METIIVFFLRFEYDGNQHLSILMFYGYRSNDLIYIGI